VAVIDDYAYVVEDSINLRVMCTIRVIVYLKETHQYILIVFATVFANETLTAPLHRILQSYRLYYYLIIDHS